MYVGMIREPKPFSSYLNNEMVKILETTPFFLAAGNIGLNLILMNLRSQPLHIGSLLVDIIAIGISLIIFILPPYARAKLAYKLSCFKDED
jgi:hypothetical protein